MIVRVAIQVSGETGLFVHAVREDFTIARSDGDNFTETGKVMQRLIDEANAAAAEQMARWIEVPTEAE